MPSSTILFHTQSNLTVLDVLRSLINIIFEMPFFVKLYFRFINKLLKVVKSATLLHTLFQE
jgi:hypothetical protein